MWVRSQGKKELINCNIFVIVYGDKPNHCTILGGQSNTDQKLGIYSKDFVLKVLDDMEYFLEGDFKGVYDMPKDKEEKVNIW